MLHEASSGGDYHPAAGLEGAAAAPPDTVCTADVNGRPYAVRTTPLPIRVIVDGHPPHRTDCHVDSARAEILVSDTGGPADLLKHFAAGFSLAWRYESGLPPVSGELILTPPEPPAPSRPTKPRKPRRRRNPKPPAEPLAVSRQARKAVRHG